MYEHIFKDWNPDDYLGIEGVTFAPESSKYLLCQTSAAVIEVFKRSSLYLFADQNGIQGAASYTAQNKEVICHLPMALPVPEPGTWVEERGIFSRASPFCVSQDLLKQLNQEIDDETGGVRRVSSWPIHRAFVYLDISDFSKFKDAHQALVIRSLLDIVQKKRNWHYGRARELPSNMEAKLCIGDGYIFVFRQSVEATFFAAYLARLIEEFVAAKKLPVAFHFRMGVHAGPVYCFWDYGRDGWNYIGKGINGGNRVLSAIGKDTDDVIYVSGEVRSDIMATNLRPHPHADILGCMHNRGRRADKHGNYWRVYEVNHSDLIPRDNMPMELKL